MAYEIKNIILDVGKVLVEWDCDSVFRRLGFDETAIRAVAEATVLSADWNEYDRGTLEDGEQLEFFIRKAPEYERQIRLFWENIGLAVTVYPYTLEWIRAMKAAGYGVYILSNYAKHTYECSREALSFEEEADGAVFSFQEKVTKPQPEIYRILLERYGLEPDSCVFLDDREDNVRMAENLGIHGICFTAYEAAVRRLKEFGVSF